MNKNKINKNGFPEFEQINNRCTQIEKMLDNFAARLGKLENPNVKPEKPKKQKYLGEGVTLIDNSKLTSNELKDQFIRKSGTTLHMPA